MFQRIYSLRSTYAIALVVAGCCGVARTVGAQTASADQSGGDLEEIVVTGTHIRGAASYDQPTPVTTVTTQDLQAAAPTNLFDGLTQLPQFTGSGTGRTCCDPGSHGNFLNLRNLGANRLLLLLDGNRLTPTLENGVVDVNLLPELLVEHVDVVTGGASAVYGSDAVSGVVNYIIDNSFEGIRFNGQSGVSTYDDNFHYKAGVAGGLAFAGGRAHVVASFEHFDSDGVPDISDRAAARNAHFMAGNGTAAAPFNVVFGARQTTATDGGLIVNSSNLPIANAAAPLAGIQFLPNGATSAAVLGMPIAGSPNTRIGGDGYVYGPNTLLAALRTDKLYSALTYELTDSVKAALRVNAGWTDTSQSFVENGQRGATAFTIYRENPYLPSSVTSAMDAAGVTSFRLGRQSHDFGLVQNLYDTRTYHADLGLQGTTSSSWAWRANASHGETRLDGDVTHNAILDNLYAAADAVTDPATGQTVCRVTLTNPGQFPGCVPINLFGNGTPSQAALDYVTGTSTQFVKNTQTLAAISATGDLFSLPAGTSKAAVGAEYRRRSLLEESNAVALGQINVTGVRGVPASICAPPIPCRYGRFNFGNFGTADAHDDVKEAFGEVQVPLLHELPLVNSLEVNGAVRYTDYSASGGVTTWKAGVSYEPVSDLRFRVTRSRDIRAPNLYELFAGPVVTSVSGLVDPATGISYSFIPSVIRGNPNLVPEEADTLTLGLVYRPSWLPGFSGSVDYYDIDIGGALASTDGQATVRNCAAGDQAACALITRDAAGVIQLITIQQINLNSRRAKGVDLDLSYTHAVGPGTLGLRALVTHAIEFVDTVGGVSRDFAGANPIPEWRGNLSVNYEVGRFSLLVQERYIGKTRPSPTSLNVIWADPFLDSAWYTDLTATMRLGAEDQFELYGTVNNVFNEAPPLFATTTNPGLAYPAPVENYDLIGTYFSAGVRVKF